MLSFTDLLLVSVAVLGIYFFLLRKKLKYPPGPAALPLIGNLWQLRKSRHEPMAKWAKEFGPVFQVFIGRQRCYVISDVKLLKETFNGQNFVDRGYNEVLFMTRGGPHGVVASSGHEWMEQRRFTLRHLRDFGFGKKGGEELIVGEVNEFLSSLAENLNTPVAMYRTFNVAILNTLWIITTGKRYHQDDPKLWSIFNQFRELQGFVGKHPALILMPSLAKMLPERMGWKVATEMIQLIQKTLGDIVDEHLKTYPEDGEPRDFLDAYIAEIKRTTDANSSFFREIGVRSLRALMVDFFIAGSETVSNTLSWAVLYLAKFPEIQKKMQEEMDGLVGRNRRPNLSDRPSLPYVEAITAETLRHSSITPLGVNHESTTDVEILGFDCPKGTQIIPNFYHIHYNPEIFPEPEQFRPERFLSEDGTTFRKNEAMMAFSIGKRQCLGETLARDEIFLFLTHLFHRFNIQLAPESRGISLEPAPSFILAPQDYKVVITDRD